MKYLISPTYNIAEYWAREYNLKRKDFKIITREEQLRGLRVRVSDIVFIYGSEFDYPEHSINSYIQRTKFYNLLREAHIIIDRDKLHKEYLKTLVYDLEDSILANIDYCY